MVQISWQGWRQWSLTPSSGMSGSQEFQHQLGTSGWKAVKNVNWRRMEKLAASECVAVGECGLDETAGDMELQEKVFKGQILLTHQLKKPLVLHLRGKTPRTTSVLYGRALALTTSVLYKRYKVYLHSFSAGQAEFQLWHRSFPELLVVVPGSLPVNSAVKLCWDPCLQLSLPWKRIAPTWLPEAGSWTAPTRSMSRLSPWQRSGTCPPQRW